MNLALKHLATILTASEAEQDDLLSPLVEAVGKNYTKAIEVEMAFEGEIGQVKQVVLKTFDAEHLTKYLFRKGPPYGTSPTITYCITKPSKADKRTPGQCAVSVFQKKFLAYLKEMAESVNPAISLFGKAAAAAIENRQEWITTRIVELAEQVAPTKESAILTLVSMSDDGERKYPHEVEPLRSYFIERADPGTKKRSALDSVGENGLCSCCGEVNAQVFLAPPQTLGYFTIDKPGFITGGFNVDQAWRNFPLCAQCSLDIRRGHKATQAHLNFSLYGTRYLLIPSFADWKGLAVRTVVKNMAAWRTVADASLQRDAELLFAHSLAREETISSLTYLFYRMKNTRMEILCTIEGVLPSRLAEVANAADSAEKHPLLSHFGEWANAPKLSAITIDFRLIRDLYQPHTDSKKDPPCHDFLRAVQRIVYGQPFEVDEFFDAAMAYLRQDLRAQQSQGKEPWLLFSAHRTLAAALWLAHLDLISFASPSKTKHQSKGDAMSDFPQLNAEDLNDRFDQFFQIFAGLFAGEAQRACYLMGVLCAQVLNEQRRRFDNRQPFFRNLKDLTLNEPELRGLLPKIKSKLVEYEIDHFYWGLEQAIAERFRRSGQPWKTTNSEINFFFTLGLCEARLFSSKANPQSSTSEQEQ